MLDRGARTMQVILTVIAVVGTVQVLFMIGVELNRAAQAAPAIRQLELDVAGLQREADRLQAVIDNGDTDSYREQLARRQGFIYPDETRVFIIGHP
jgi:cell division protein FtsB